MSEDTTVHAELRENFGKGFARRLRAAGKIPAVLYGHGTDPVHVALPGHQMLLLVRRANALIELDIAEIDAVALLICWRIHLRRSLWQCQKKGSRGNGSQQKMRYTVS